MSLMQVAPLHTVDSKILSRKQPLNLVVDVEKRFLRLTSRA